METQGHLFTQDKKTFQSVPKEDRKNWIKQMLDTPQSQSGFQVNFPEFPKNIKYKLNGFNLHISIWEPESKSDALIFFLPGMDDHVGTSSNYAKYMAQKCNVIFAGYDYENTGKSQGNDMANILDIQYLVTSTEKVIDYVLSLYPSVKKVFLSGLSMGGLISFKLSIKNPNRYNGIIFLSPALRQNKESQYILKKFGLCIGYLFKTLRLPIDTQMDVSVQYKSLQKQLKEDKYIYTGKVIPNAARVVLNAMGEVENQFHLLESPYITFQAEVDKMVDPFHALDLEEQSKSKDKTTIYMKGMWHWMWFSPGMDKVYEIAGKWIKERI